MSKTFVCRSTALSDTFETNFPSTETGTFESGWPRQMTEATASEVESNWVFPNLSTEKIAYHVEIGKTDWSTDRVGSADWTVVFRTGATGDANVQLDTVTLKRVSSDGNTIRATITLTSGATDGCAADTNVGTHTASADTTLDNPSGAASTDHLAVVFTCDNIHEHGGDDTISVEQNLITSTRVTAPIDDPATGYSFGWIS